MRFNYVLSLARVLPALTIPLQLLFGLWSLEFGACVFLIWFHCFKLNTSWFMQHVRSNLLSECLLLISINMINLRKIKVRNHYKVVL